MMRLCTLAAFTNIHRYYEALYIYPYVLQLLQKYSDIKKPCTKTIVSPLQQISEIIKQSNVFYIKLYNELYVMFASMIQQSFRWYKRIWRTLTKQFSYWRFLKKNEHIFRTSQPGSDWF